MIHRPESFDTRVRTLGILVAWSLLWALLLIGFVRLLGSVALMEPDEGRNAEVAREMAQSGDFVVPHLNGLPYLDKPVLLFAASALSIRAMGAGELAARLPPLLFSLATVALVIAFGWLRFGRMAGLAAGMMLASSPIVLVFSGIVIFDAVMMFWVSGAAIAFHFALERSHRGWCFAGWTAVGFAVLTKGPVGLVLPVMIALGEALALRQSPRRLFCLSGLTAFVLLVGPWFLAVSLRHPEFPHYAFIRETFERVATDSMRRTGPWYYFLPILLLGAFPWVTVLLVGARRLAQLWRQRARDEVFLLLWVLLPALFFSISQSKRPGYILPVIPAVALLGARLLQLSPGSLRYVIWVSAPVLAGVGAALLLAGDWLASLIREAPGVAEEARALAPYVGAGLIATAGLALMGLRWRGAALAGFVLAPFVLIIGSQGALTALGEQRSTRQLAQTIGQATDGRGRVIAIGVYPASLSFYLEQTLLLATQDASEIRSNYIQDYDAQLRDAPGSTLRPLAWWYQEFQQCPPGTLFLIGSGRRWEKERGALAAKLPLLYANHLFVLYGPCNGGGH